MRRWALILCLSVGSAACAASAASTKKARASAYDTEFARVWNVVSSLVHDDYPNLVIDDATRGRILTDWHLIQQKAQPDLEGPGEEGMLRGGIFMRLGVRVEGTDREPPWTVTITAEAAEYKPGMAQLVPFERGGADEPPWVQGRIDKLYARIYERLAKYAVPLPAGRGGPEAPPPAADTSRWQALPAPAGRVVAEVQAAAQAGDADGVAAHMADPFTSNIGEDIPRANTVALWKSDPASLVALAAALLGDCVLARGVSITCSVADAPLEARFEERGGRWLLVAFAEK